ncbi:MAG TPA: HlyD family type I secretion periplasmic adaptor subunit [Xanthobacteraceae bacterium]|nr:HlyD family type I secretion periplasmic adaptor subunit [Xanthobacteraceae bacterium]
MNGAERDPRRAIRRLNLAGFTVMAVALGGVGGWAATTHIAGAVIASGTIVVESNVKKVQHNSGGIVGEIFVKEGDAVDAGQILVRLDDTIQRATLGIVQSQLDVFMAREGRLTAERDGAEAIQFHEALIKRQQDATVASAIAGESKLFEARRHSRAGQRSQLQERIAQTQNEIRGLIAQQQAKEKELELIGEELVGVSDLFKRNLVSIVRYMALQRDQAKLVGERGQFIAEIARARARIAETEIQILQLDQDFRTEVLRDLREAQARLAELQERVSAAQDELQRIDIRAPQAGVVYQLTVHTVGGVIARGDTIMQIVPHADALLVEAKLAPSDVDQVSIGSRVHVRIMAGNRRTSPDLEGVVSHVGPDVSREQQAGVTGQVTQTYYLVRVKLPASEVKRLGDLQLIPGMPAEIYIQTENRTPLDYLVKPLTEQIARTFRER